MNHLAHALLAGPDRHSLVGNMLGDFWHGAPAADWPLGVACGLRLHRHIDSFTDQHPDFAAARAVLPAPYRRYAGILLDVYFDYLLARDWARLGVGDLTGFNHHVAAVLRSEQHWLPARMQPLLGALERGLFVRYARKETLGDVLREISGRLSRDNPLLGSEQVLIDRAAALEDAFERFFPQLQEFAENERASYDQQS